MPQCCAYGCRNEWGKPNTDKSVRFHKFPKDEELKKKWIQATKWKNWKPSLCSVLCSVHFQEDDLDRSSPFRVYLKKGAVPTIFPAFPKHLQTKTLLKKRKAPEEKILRKLPPTKKAKLVEPKWIKFTSTVVSCTKSKLTELNGKKVSLEGYDVVLDDTIFFPEGGGQPCDQGSLNGKRVQQVVRNGDKAVHFVEEPFEVGEKVEAKVNWERRFDHMQQHSGQHLITAIIDKMFNFATVSWYMGEDDSYIELDTPSITQNQIAEAELEINERIQSGKKVTVDVYKDIQELTDHVPDEGMRAPRGLPNDHVGYIRVINIEDLESNMCCGTHVKNLSQLQVVKLLHAEKSKRKNQTLLHFLVGNRVIRRLQKCLDTEQKLTVLLKNNASAHVDLVDKLQKNVKQLNKSLQNVTKDLAILEAQKFKNQPPTTPYFILHRSGVTAEFINAFLKEVGTTSTLLCISVGEDKGPGNITLHGDNKDVKNLGNGISELLNGKGFTQGNRFQAKVNNIEKRSKMEELFVKYFQNGST